MGFIEHGLVGLWTVLSNVWPFLLVLTPVIFIHELGHFLVARWCGVKVQTFSIGFGKEIFHFYDRYGTRWRFAWVPLGGYVKFMDDDNASSFPSREALDRMTPAEREGAFQTKPLAARAAIVAAGPIANFLLSIGIFTLLLTFLGEMVTPPRVGEVEAGSPAATAGVKVGDTVIRINGEDIASFGEIDRMVALYGNRPLDLVVDRGGKPVELKVPPASGVTSDAAGRKTERPTIGILPPLMPARVG
ncbi:MAG TPA: site-2 protease family protein, partial [Hyphomicrobiaceae bacterium]|nr:site-2 protease family protein [Hyphomicrobiaceae bacterium]